MAGDDLSKDKASKRSTCATHGLVYDPTLHSGCTLCRRAEPKAAPAKNTDSGRSLKPLIGLLIGVPIALALLGVTYKVAVKSEPVYEAAPALGPEPIRDPGRGLRPRGPQQVAGPKCGLIVDECFGTCPRKENEIAADCADRCLRGMEECIDASPTPPSMDSTKQVALFATGVHASNIGDGIHEAFFGDKKPPKPGLPADCLASFTRAFLRLDIEGKTGVPRQLHVYTKESADCVAEELTKHAFPKHYTGDYVVFAMVQPKKDEAQ